MKTVYEVIGVPLSDGADHEITTFPPSSTVDGAVGVDGLVAHSIETSLLYSLKSKMFRD